MNFKKTLFILLALSTITLGLTACKNKQENQPSSVIVPSIEENTNSNPPIESEEIQPISSTEEPVVQIPNPVVEYDTVEDATIIVGHLSTLPTIYERYNQKASVINNTLIQIIYSDDEGEILTLREKAGVEEDISGNYNSYPYTSTFESNGHLVTVKGEDEDNIKLVIWNDGAYAHSLDYKKGVFLEEVTAAVNDIQ